MAKWRGRGEGIILSLLSTGGSSSASFCIFALALAGVTLRLWPALARTASVAEGLGRGKESIMGE